MSFEQQEFEVPVQQEGAMEKEICRDFKKGDCRRGEKCIYHHPKLDVCRDFRNGRCTRPGCRFSHLTREEEETYNNSGIVPAHINNGQTMNSNAMNGHQVGNGFGYDGILGKRNYNSMSGPSPMPMHYGQQNISPMPYGQQNVESPQICRDFEKGDCSRGARCKFYHPKLIICRDFQKEKCERDSCRFLHMTQEEEKTYLSNGTIPDHIDKEKLKKNRVMTPPNGSAGGMGEMYGTQRGEMYGTQRQDNYQTGSSNTSFAAVVQENQTLKSKLTEMQQQINELRKMNDTLCQQNNNFHNGYTPQQNTPYHNTWNGNNANM